MERVLGSDPGVQVFGRVLTFYTLILASEKFHTYELANFTLVTLASLHYNIYKNKIKLTTFKISYLN